jgi:hypothetical protein
MSQALKHDLRLLSAYTMKAEMWLITEANPSATTVITADEY